MDKKPEPVALISDDGRPFKSEQEARRVWLNWYPTMNCRSAVCYDSREEMARFARHDIAEQVEFVEVME